VDDRQRRVAALPAGGRNHGRTGKDPGEYYAELAQRHGEAAYTRIDAAATPAQKKRLKALQPSDVRASELAGEPILAKLTSAPGNQAPIGGLKVTTENAWFAARPSGTEDIYKIYAESFRGPQHLAQLVQQAQQIVDAALSDA
jgi:phosphoglucomutase